MSQTEPIFEGSRYEIVAFAHGQEVVLYHEFGSYQGEWMMVAKDPEQYFVYKGYYGSCSGCDSLEAWRDYSSDDITLSKAKEFVFGKDGKDEGDDYRSFIEIPAYTMRNLVAAGTLAKIMPANVRDTYSEVDVPGFCADVMLRVKIDEGMEIKVEDILNAKNQEIKQKALKAFGYEKFFEQAEMETIHVDGDNSLVRKGDIVFAYVKDSSTPRRYLLRVPPTMKRVKEAIAWTFGMSEAQYKPLAET